MPQTIALVTGNNLSTLCFQEVKMNFNVSLASLNSSQNESGYSSEASSFARPLRKPKNRSFHPYQVKKYCKEAESDLDLSIEVQSQSSECSQYSNKGMKNALVKKLNMEKHLLSVMENKKRQLEEWIRQSRATIEGISKLLPTLNPEPKHANRTQKLIWLQKERNVGVFVVCDSCNKHRYLPHVKDPSILDPQWFCSMNKDPLANDCSKPEVTIPKHIQNDLIFNKYNAGSLVWAKIKRIWWPAIVDDDIETCSFYKLARDKFNVAKYHVTFFGKHFERDAWVSANERSIVPLRHSVPVIWSVELDHAIVDAKEAVYMTLLDRLKKYSYLNRYYLDDLEDQELLSKLA